MSFAQQQLLKIKMYRAPRDKVVCVLNCCKVIFGFLSTSKSSDTSADSFVPLLIYVVLGPIQSIWFQMCNTSFDSEIRISLEVKQATTYPR